MENLFAIDEKLRKAHIPYEKKLFENEYWDIHDYIDAFYLYAYIIEKGLYQLIRNNLKDNESMDFKLSYVLPDVYQDRSEDTRLSEEFEGCEAFVLNLNDRNVCIEEILLDMIHNFISFYKLGNMSFYKLSDVPTDIICFTASRLDVIRAYYAEYQRIEYELRDIIEDYQDDFDLNRRVYCPDDNTESLKRKKMTKK